jgi:hypothetical protein
MTHPALSSRLVTTAHCTNLRHKGMYVLAEHTPEMEAYRDSLDATAYWCVRTQRPFGPDGHPVTAEECTHGRSCCDH